MKGAEVGIAGSGEVRKIPFSQRGNEWVLPAFTLKRFDDSDDQENDPGEQDYKMQNSE